MQHRMFDATDVEIDAPGVTCTARAHPVPLDVLVDHGGIVGGVEIAHLVPARAGPLRHHVHLAPVLARAVSQVERDTGPFLHTGERRDRVADGVVGVECRRLEVRELRQEHGERGLGNCMCAALVVVDDREGLAPVALAREQPVTETVGGGRFAETLRREPFVHPALRFCDGGDAVERHGLV